MRGELQALSTPPVTAFKIRIILPAAQVCSD